MKRIITINRPNGTYCETFKLYFFTVSYIFLRLKIKRFLNIVRSGFKIVLWYCYIILSALDSKFKVLLGQRAVQGLWYLPTKKTIN